MDWGKLAMVLMGGLAGGLLLQNMMGQQGQQPQAPAAMAPPAPPAATDPMAQTPDYNKLLTANNKAARSGPSAGPSSTFKTGAGGVDPNALALGTNTLLGA